MRKIILLIALCCCVFSLHAQGVFNRPDYKVIEEATSNKTSEMYYPKLMERYNNNDTTLGIKEYRMLYYGRFFNMGEESSFGASISDEAEKIREYISKETLNDEDYRAIIKLSNKLLEDNPFDLRTLYGAFRTYMKLGDTVAAAPYLEKTRNIVNTILSTGDGLSEETAFHVLQVSHEYFVVNALGYTQEGGQNLTPNQCDRLTVAENDNNVEALYFDVKQIFDRYRRLLNDNPPTIPKEKKKRKKKKG